MRCAGSQPSVVYHLNIRIQLGGRFSLDTNILAYAVDRDSGDRHEQAKELLVRATVGDCVLSLQALAEFSCATTCTKLLKTEHASTFVRDWLDVFPTVSANAAALVQAMDAVAEHRLSFGDAMVWATLRQNGCLTLITEDMQDGRRLGGVEFLNPFAPDATDRRETLLEV